MDESRALKKLQEAADLIGMLEDITQGQSLDRISPSSWAGLKITLRNVRESLVGSYDVLAADLVSRARNSSYARQAEVRPELSTATRPAEKATDAAIPSISDAQKQNLLARKDLRSSLEKFVTQNQGQ